MKNCLKYAWVFLLFALSTSGLSSCQNRWEGETVESAYKLPEYPDPEYKFSRNGRSSVDYYECTLLDEPLQIIYSTFLREARISSEGSRNTVYNYFRQGLYGLVSPQSVVASSVLHQADRAEVINDIEDCFRAIERLSGLGTEAPNLTRNQRAAIGVAGYVGTHIGDDYIFFATQDGLVPAEYYRELVRGAIYLDLILNVHLASSLYAPGELLTRHEHTYLPDGHNYTELEHHWDLAFGYYTHFWQPLVSSINLPLLGKSRIQLYNAFALGRWALTNYRYDILQEQLQLIRIELSKVVAVRALQLLQGNITMANYREEPENALFFLSQGVGALYSLQFACDKEGQPLFSYSEVKAMQEQLLAGNGLWDRDQLIGSDGNTGLLHTITKEVAHRFELPLQEIK